MELEFGEGLEAPRVFYLVEKGFELFDRRGATVLIHGDDDKALNKF